MTGVETRVEESAVHAARVPVPSNRPLKDRTTSRLPRFSAKTVTAENWLFATILLVGVGLRVAMIPTVAGRIDSDEASIWLQALHMTKGEFSAFFWGNNYGGTAPQLVLAGLIEVFGPHLLLIRIVNLFYCVVAAVLLWDAARRVFGRHVADAALGLYFLFPAFAFWWDTREYGHYSGSIALAILTVWVAVRLHFRPRLAWAIGLGLLVGLCFWSYQLLAVIMMLPAVAALVFRPIRWRDRLAAILVIPIGAAPWLVHNVLNGWPSLIPIPSYPTVKYLPPPPRLLIRLHDAVAILYPSGFTAASGVSFSPELATVIGFSSFGIAAVAAVVFLLRRHWAPLTLAGSVLLWPLLIAEFRVNSIPEAYRYGMYLYPPLFVLVALLVANRRQAAALAIAALLCSVAGLYDLTGGFAATGTYTHDPQLDRLAARLEATGNTKVYADYWMAYALSAQSNEAIIADPIVPSYYPGYRAIVSTSSPTVIVVFANHPNDHALGKLLTISGPLQPTREQFGGYAIYRFKARIDLGQLQPGGWAGLGQEGILLGID